MRNLEVLFQTSYLHEQVHLSSGRQQNDVRVTFYKHLINTINSSIHLVIFSDSVLFSDAWWSNNLSDYKISKRHFANDAIDSREKEIDYIDLHLLFSFFIFVFHTFESSFRIVCKQCFSDDYYITKENGEKKKRDIKNLCEVILRKVRVCDKERQNFLEIVVKFRNSIHNNGVYIHDKERSPSPYNWKNNPYAFKHGKQIELEKGRDLWIEYVRFAKEFTDIFEDLIKSPPVRNHSFIEDVTEPSE